MPAAVAMDFGRPGPAGEPAALEALADARQVEEAVRVREERLRRVGHVLALVAPEQDRDVVGLENRRVRVAREALSVLECRHRSVGARGGAAVDRKVLLGQARYQAAEVGQPPGDGDRKPGRVRLVPPLDRTDRLLEAALCLAELAPP